MSDANDTTRVSPAPRITGRSSSHFTRLVRVFAQELGVACEFAPVYDLASLEARDYAGNPALKLPVLAIDGATVFGAENICRVLAESAPERRRVVWPEDVRELQARNVQELVWHAMQAQVQLSFGTQIAHLPADSIYFAKAAAGLRNTLAWLDERLVAVIEALPPRDLSLLEASLFCLVEHLAFRTTVPLAPYGQLTAFAREFGQRASARSTAYRFDAPPSAGE
ncbi:glutathione S-transferase family protein [Rhodanobacter denitrificans]|uniref:Glutathione S-transferase n=1 Tax=Rhodanobacter denitrificans TaxID=666685 RepID=M4NPM8_9GAMM|nr:glutathione S-transferase N-terminal domain-containing protein [Rhodanobacter denitrificans]AGG89601.1 glutathione S-transferase [Rhodanobacter denitrificans]UJM88481.1 glutathione S-transferase N-terminal domain-containing protein [Rhodanobacter denitrificans]